MSISKILRPSSGNPVTCWVNDDKDPTFKITKHGRKYIAEQLVSKGKHGKEDDWEIIDLLGSVPEAAKRLGCTIDETSSLAQRIYQEPDDHRLLMEGRIRV